MKIALCCLAIGDSYKEHLYYSLKSHEEYAAKHGYDYITDESVYDESRPIAWSKILLVKKLIETGKYDYVVWVDADAIIVNMEQTLEDKINGYMEDKDIMVMADDNLINTGLFFVKNTQWSLEFLDLWYSQTDFIEHGNWEQTAFCHLVDSQHENGFPYDIRNYVDKIKIIPRNGEFQSYWYHYFPGHFIVHFVGIRSFLHGLKLHCNMFYPNRKNNETEEMWKDRISWLQNHYRQNVDRHLSTREVDYLNHNFCHVD